jgi:hypothetical protein
MKIPHHLIIVLGLSACLGFNTAFAHSFNIVLIAPFNESTGQATLDGFLLATREQDSHEFEESDGHLGGLDSYLFKVDSLAGTEQLEAVVRESVPLFAVGDVASSATREILEQYQVVVVDPAASTFWASTLADPGRLSLMNGDPLRIAFEQAYGYIPDAEALRGYLAARIIATVVRNSSGNPRFSAPRLRLAVEQSLQTAPWQAW